LDIENVIKKFIEEEFLLEHQDILELNNNDSLLEKGIIDSFNMMKLLAFIETTFSIKIGDEELMPENFDSINAIANFIRGKK